MIRVDHLVEPPRDMVAPHDIQLVMTVGVGAVLALMTVAVIAGCIRQRTALYGLILLGGGLCMFNETALDILGQCYFPARGDWQAYETLGRPVPLWVAFAYFAYFGGLTAGTVFLLRRGLSRRQIWTGLACIEVLNCLLELPPLAKHLYLYYGEQPLRIAGKFPAVWLVFNCVGSFLAATLIVKTLPYLKGVRLGAVLFLPPICQHAAFWLGVPYVAAINSDAGHGLRTVAALATMALGLGLMYLLIDAVADRGEKRTAAPVPLSESVHPVPALHG